MQGGTKIIHLITFHGFSLIAVRKVLAETKTLPTASQLKTRGSLMVSTWLSILLVLVVITLHWCDPQPYSQFKPLSRSLTLLRPLLLYSNFLPSLPARPWVIVPLGGWERVVGIMWRWRGAIKLYLSQIPNSTGNVNESNIYYHDVFISVCY